MTSDLREVAERCELLFVAAVTTAYRSLAAALAPHPESGHGVVLFSGKLCGSAEFGRAVAERRGDRMRGLFPGVERARSQVQRGLTDFGAVAHATIALADISRIDRAEELLFYREGLSERTVVLMERVEREFQCGARTSTVTSPRRAPSATASSGRTSPRRSYP